jgi:hypothetical protein
VAIVASRLLPAAVSHAAHPVTAEGDTLRGWRRPISSGSILLIEEGGGPRWSLTPVGRSLRGSLLRTTADSLWVVPDGADRAWPLPLRDLREVHVLNGRSHVAGALAGTAIGGLVGAGVGLLSAVILVTNDPAGDSTLALAYLPFVGVMAGAPIGGIIGGAWGLDRWERVR